MRLWRLGMRLFRESEDYGVPNSGQSTKMLLHEASKKRSYEYKHEYWASFLNDAFELGIWQRYTENGVKEEKLLHMFPTPIFRKIAFWYLWRWACGEWFGLRRWLYYWFLHREVMSWRNFPKEAK